MSPQPPIISHILGLLLINFSNSLMIGNLVRNVQLYSQVMDGMPQSAFHLISESMNQNPDIKYLLLDILGLILCYRRSASSTLCSQYVKVMSQP